MKRFNLLKSQLGKHRKKLHYDLKERLSLVYPDASGFQYDISIPGTGNNLSLTGMSKMLFIIIGSFNRQTTDS